MDESTLALARHYVFVPMVDEMSGRDIARVSGSHDFILLVALGDPNCVCANTLGYLKPQLNSIAKCSYMPNITEGLFVKISHLIKLYDTNPVLARTIESMAVPLKISVNFSP